jgi:uncharacterized OsmC-like protein
MWDLPEYLTRKRDKVEAMRERLRASGGPTPLRAVARIAAGSGVRPVRVREFTIITDAGAGLGGFELGPTAPELLLSALASCIAHSFAVVAADQGVALESLEVAVTGNLDYRGTLAVDDTTPVHPTDLAYEVRYTSGASDEAVAAVWRDVERLCPVLHALRTPLSVAGSLQRG